MLLGGLVALHLAAVALFYPPSIWVSGKPLLSGDYGLHYYQVDSVLATLRSTGRAWAYDPSFCAGYPLGTLFDLDLKLVEVLALGLTAAGVPLAVAYNLLVLTFFLLAPVLLYLGGRGFGLQAQAALLVALAGTALWHVHHTTALFHRSGMFAFVFSVSLSFCALALAHRLRACGGLLPWLGLTAVLAAAFLSHAAAALLVLPGLLVLEAAQARAGRGRGGLAVLTALVVALAANSWWLVTAWRFWPYHRAASQFPAPGLGELVELLTGWGLAPIGLAGFGLWGFARAKAAYPGLAAVGRTWILLCFTLSHLSGGITWIQALEPWRFVIPMVQISAVGAVVGVLASRARLASLGPALRVAGVVAAAGLVTMLWAPGQIRGGRLTNDPGSLARFAEILEARTDSSARIAVADEGPGWLGAARLRLLLDREFIGGPFPTLNLVHGYASANSSRFFDVPYAALAAEEFLRWAELFDVGWVVARGRACDVYGGFEGVFRWSETFPLEESGVGGLCVFAVDRKFGRALDGHADVEVSLNRLRVTNARQGTTVLKHHWDASLRTEPPLPLRRHPVPRSPIGFLQIDNGAVEAFDIVSR